MIDKQYLCNKCGHHEFELKEITYWWCEPDEEGRLDCSGATNDDCTLKCTKCRAEKSLEDFNDIDYR